MSIPSPRQAPPGVVFSVFEGHVNNEELLDHQQRLGADPDFRPTMNHVIDTRGVTDTSITAFGVRLLTFRSNLGPKSRRAIIVGDASSVDLKAAAAADLAAAFEEAP